MDGEKKNELLRHIRTEIDQQKREVYQYYAELKLKLPKNIKTATIGELREKGAFIGYPDMIIPRNVEEHFRTKADSERRRINLSEKLQELREHHKGAILSYYTSIKQQLQPELRNKKMCDLDEEDWQNIGIDITRFRESYARRKRAY